MFRNGRKTYYIRKWGSMSQLYSWIIKVSTTSTWLGRGTGCHFVWHTGCSNGHETHDHHAHDFDSHDIFETTTEKHYKY